MKTVPFAKDQSMYPFAGILLLTGLVLASRLYHQAFSAKKINHLYGYRTKTHAEPRGMGFAQRYSADEMIKLGLVMMALAVLAWMAEIHLLATFLWP